MELLDYEVKAEDQTFGHADLVPDAAIRQFQKSREDTEPSMSEGWGHARQLESTAVAAAKFAVDSEYAPDYNFRLGNHYDELTKEIPVEFHNIFEEARSLPHAERIRRQYFEEMTHQEELAKMGMTGAALQFGAAIFDEGTIALGLTAPEIAASHKLSRLKKAIAAGGYAAIENAALEAYLNEASVTRNPSDILIAGLAGFALATPLTYLTKKEGQLAVDAAGMASRDVQQSVLKDAIDKGVIFKPVDTSAGSMETRLPTSLAREDLTAAELNAPFSYMGGARFDMVGKTMSSVNPLSRKAASEMAEDATGHAGGRVQQETASEYATRLHEVVASKFYREAEPGFKQWIKENNLPWTARFSERERFFEKVTESLREGGIGDPIVDKVAGTLGKQFKTYLKELKDAGVKGFEEVKDLGNYIPRVHNRYRISYLNQRYGQNQMTQLIEGAIKKNQPDIDQNLLRKLALGYWKNINKMTHTTNHAMSPLNLDNKEMVRELLEDADLDPEDIDSLMRTLQHNDKNKKGGKVKQAKRRVDLDENFSMTLKSADGKEETVSFKDMLENNAERLFSGYSRSISGHIAMAKKMGVKSKSDWQAYKLRIERHGQSMNQNPDELKADVNRLETMYKSITGQSLETDPGSFLARGSRLIRDFNFVRIMNQVGWAQLAEIGNLMATGTFRAALRHMPAFKEIITELKTGKLPEDSLAAELEAIIPLGTHRLRNQVHTREDDLGFGAGIEYAGTNNFKRSVESGMHKVDNFLQHGKRFTADISGMAPITLTLQRMAGKAIAQHFMDAALGSADKMSKKRLASIGLDDKMLGRVLDQLRTHASTENSKLFKGKKLRKLNIEDWTDTEARDAFIASTYRMGRRIIQENDIGNTHQFMHGTVGKILTQFRSFMLVAWAKQTLYNVHMADMRAFSSFALSTVFGGLAYGLQTTINSVGRDDQSEYLEKRLSPEKFAAAAFQRAAASSLVPAAIDTMWHGVLDYDPIFSGRSTGLATSLVAGNPTVDALGKLGGIPGLLKLGRDDREFSQDEYRNLVSLLPFSNAMGVRNVLQTLGEDLPKHSK